MQMKPHRHARTDRVAYGSHARLDERRVGVADRIGEPDFVDAALGQHHRDPADLRFGDTALDRAAKGSGNATRHMRSRLAHPTSEAHHLGDDVGLLLARPAGVGHAMAGARRDDAEQHLSPSSNRALGALAVGNEGADAPACGGRAGTGDDFGGIGELRERLRRHEARRVDLGEAARGERG